MKGRPHLEMIMIQWVDPHMPGHQYVHSHWVRSRAVNEGLKPFRESSMMKIHTYKLLYKH